MAEQDATGPGGASSLDRLKVRRHRPSKGRSRKSDGARRTTGPPGRASRSRARALRRQPARRRRAPKASQKPAGLPGWPPAADQSLQNGNGLRPKSVAASGSSGNGVEASGGGGGALLRQDRFQETQRILTHLHRYELVLRKHWWILVAALCVALGPVACHICTAPSSYQSVGRLWMPGRLELREGQLYNEELTSFMGTQVELLRSSTIYNRALSNIMAAHAEWHPALTNLGPKKAGYFNLSIKEFPKSAVIEVKAVGKLAEAVQAFVNAVMEEYQSCRKGVRLERSGTALTSITEQVTQLDQEVKKQQERLHSFTVSNNVVLLQEQGSSAGQFAARLSKQLAALRTELRLLQMITPEQLVQASQKHSTTALDTPPMDEDFARELVTSLVGPQAEFLRATQQAELLKAKQKDLARFLRPLHPKMVALSKEIAEQERVGDIFKRQSFTQMSNRLHALQLQIRNLEAAVAEWEAKALDASRKMADYERIRQDVQRTQALYDKLVGVIQQVDVNRTLDQENVRVMETASPPQPVRRTLIFLGLGCVSGMLLAVGLLYVVSLLDDGFITAAELRTQLPENVIGQIPNVSASRRHPRLELADNAKDRPAFAESFRHLRSWILFNLRHFKGAKALLVASGLPAEGRSTIASNLATTLALSGSRVLLIDADLRQGGLSRCFGVDAEPGLADVLEERAPGAEVIRPTGTANLWLLPAGMAARNPGELFLTPKWELFLRRLRGKYDYILLDSAPVLTADDTASLAPKLDGMLFVVRAGYTSARSVRESLELLHHRQANILGIIFNRATLASNEGNGHYRQLTPDVPQK